MASQPPSNLYHLFSNPSSSSTHSPVLAEGYHSSPAGPSPFLEGSSKRQIGSPDSDGGEFDTSEAGAVKRARKRNRQALSCSECKRRKIKCDRKTPCEACCKRGEEKQCHWDSPKVEIAPQPFALATEHELLKQRVAHLESMILKGSINPYALHQPQHHDVKPPTPALTSGRGDSVDIPEDRVETDELEEDATEEAALVLEELALGRKLTRVGPGAKKGTAGVPSVGYSFTTLTHAGEASASTQVLADSQTPISRAMASLLVTPLTGRRRLVMDDIWKTIPTSKAMLDWLVASYFSRVDWSWHALHRPTFLAEFEAFTHLVSVGRKDEVDPLWLASLCMTLCLAINSLDAKIESPLVNITDSDLDTLPWTFFEAAQGCLEVGDWTGKPRIRTLQAITLFAPFLLFAGVPAAHERHQTYLGAAIRICQQLNLHRLGSDPAVMPPEDPALPTTVCTLRREIPLRIFSTLLWLDYMIVRVTTSLPPDKVNSCLPGNFDDNELSDQTIVKPRSDLVLTDISFEGRKPNTLAVVKVQVATQQHRFNEVVTGDTPIEYFTILELDTAYRTIINSLPTELRDDYVAPLSEDVAHGWRRAMCIQTIYNRLLRLHRPFMSPGYRDPKYAYSTVSAIEAARKCLISQRALQRAPLVKCGFQLLNIQGAVIALAMGIWSEWPDEDLKENSDYGLISESADFFQRYTTHRLVSVRKVAQQSMQTISLLFDAIQKRRRQSDIQKAAGEPWKSEADESYGSLLKRLGAVVVASAAARGANCEATSKTHANRPAAGSSSDPAVDATAGDPFLIDWSAGSLLGPSASLLLDSTAPSFTTDTTTDPFFSGDFDFNSLLGPPYALPPEHWSVWGGGN